MVIAAGGERYPQLAPKLERLHQEDDDLQVLMVSRGSEEDNQLKVREHGLTFTIVLQRHWEISKQYAMFATPVAYLINEAGVIISDVVAGGPAILDLASSTAVVVGKTRS